MDDHSIHGTLNDLLRLASIVRGMLQNASEGDVLTIRETYAIDCEYSLCLIVKGDDFDPASLDTSLWD